MESRADLDHSALRLAERLIQLLDRGGFSATYKYAVLVALMDLCMELTSATGVPPDMLTTRQLAEKVIELYWPHCEPYSSESGVLHQSTGGSDKPALIIRHICHFREAVDPRRERALQLSQARAKAKRGEYKALVNRVEWTLIHMPLHRLQVIGLHEERFLYDYHFPKDTSEGDVKRYQRGEPGPFDNRIDLKHGVSAAFIALNGVLRPLIYHQWAMMVASMNGLEEWQLTEFLFGATRIPLTPVRPLLLDLQGGLCFYCRKPRPSKWVVDHFIPWSRHADNSIDNLVVAHKGCNGRKSDYLAAADHVERWYDRSTQHRSSLTQIASESNWASHPARTLSVARAIYRMLPDDARLWQLDRDFVLIDHERIARKLAA